MKVLVIYSNDCWEKVNQLRNEIANRFGSTSVLRLNSVHDSHGRRKSFIRHAWHNDARKMMKQADIIVYALSEKSTTNKNVEWELKTAIRLNKYIVCLPMNSDLRLNDNRLNKIDENTKELGSVAEIIESKEDLFKIIEDYNNNSHIKLFHDNMDINILLEQYKIFSETAENLVTRRQNVNSFYISANTALITIGGSIFAIGSDNNIISKLIVLLALSIPGILLNFSWRKMIQSYYLNNQGKIKILSMIEQKLAVSLYDAEWKAMKNKFSKKKYTSFTDNEKILPVIFSCFYFIAIIAGLGFIIFYLIKLLAE